MRPDASNFTRRRLRRRGPRSSDARIRRSERYSKFSSHSQSLLSALDCDLRESRSLQSIVSQPITIFHSNVRGFISHSDELLGQIRNLNFYPSFITLNETLLDASVEQIELSGYMLVSRRDRCNREGGGIALFCIPELFDSIVHLENDEDFERSWHTLHTDLGAILLVNWYRPPDNEADSISSLQTNLDRFHDDHVGTIINGDLNVHHVQ